jgi:hypothetical protein
MCAPCQKAPCYHGVGVGDIALQLLRHLQLHDSLHNLPPSSCLQPPPFLSFPRRIPSQCRRHLECPIFCAGRFRWPFLETCGVRSRMGASEWCLERHFSQALANKLLIFIFHYVIVTVSVHCSVPTALPLTHCAVCSVPLTQYPSTSMSFYDRLNRHTVLPTTHLMRIVLVYWLQNPIIDRSLPSFTTCHNKTRTHLTQRKRRPPSLRSFLP